MVGIGVEGAGVLLPAIRVLLALEGREELEAPGLGVAVVQVWTLRM